MGVIGPDRGRLRDGPVTGPIRPHALYPTCQAW